MKKLTAGLLVLLLLQFGVIPPIAQASSDQAANCSTYARNQAESQAPSGGGMLGGAVRGAAGGAVMGAIFGGRRRGAGRGAAIGAGIGMIGSGIRNREERQANYQYYYDSCMQGAR